VLRFKQFITENAAQSDSHDYEHGEDRTQNDPTAKTNEITVGQHIAKAAGGVLQHSRSEGKSPDDILKETKKTLGNAKHAEVVKASQRHADDCINHLEKEHGIKIGAKNTHTTVHWTSQAGDIGKATEGRHNDDQSNPSDIVISHTDEHGTVHHHGISLKYGASPGVKNPGIGSMMNDTGVKEEDQGKIKRAMMAKRKDSEGNDAPGHLAHRLHQELLGHHDYQNPDGKTTKAFIKKKVSALTKELDRRRKANKAAGKDQDHDSHKWTNELQDFAPRHDRASAASRSLRSNAIGKMAAAFNKNANKVKQKGDKKARGKQSEQVKSLLNSSTSKSGMRVMLSHHNPAKGTTENHNPSDHFDKTDAMIHHYSIRHGTGDSSNSSTATIMAHPTHDHAGIPVATLGLKHNSGLATGVVGNTSKPTKKWHTLHKGAK